MEGDDTVPMFHRFRHVCVFVAVALCGVLPTGCRSGVTDFPNRLVGAGGQLFTVQDLEAIAADTTLTETQKRQAFRDLGIEDEKLISALLTL